MPRCFGPSRWIDPDRRWPDPLCFVVDHIEPVSRRPDLAMVRENLRAAHKVCNERQQPAAEVASRDW